MCLCVYLPVCVCGCDRINIYFKQARAYLFAHSQIVSSIAM